MAPHPGEESFELHIFDMLVIKVQVSTCKSNKSTKKNSFYSHNNPIGQKNAWTIFIIP